MKKTVLLGLLALFIQKNSVGQVVIDTTHINKKFHLYILAGQSNMAGRGEISELYKTELHPRVFMLNKNNVWEQAHHPLHFDKPAAGVGPGLAFAIKMAQQDSTIIIGVIPCAVGGTAIRYWEPGAYDSATKTHPYDDAIVRIQSAMKAGLIKGLLWHQGESDSRAEAAFNYNTKLQTLILRIRTLTHNNKLPVVIGELGRYKEQYHFINDQLVNIPNTIPFTAIASSAGLVHKGDLTHFDSPSAQTLGQRFAEQMIKIQTTITKKQ